MKRLLHILFTLLLAVTNGGVPECAAVVNVRWPEQGLWPENPAASKLRAVTMPMPDLATGAVTFEVPLYRLDVDELSLPLSLRYRSNGIRCDENPWPVGYGWTFLPALRITRHVLGRPDGMYEFAGDRNASTITHGEMHRCMVVRTGLDGNRGLDPERDIFTIHMPDGAFNAYYEDGILKAPGHAEYSITCDSSMEKITVKDPMGRVWDFSTIGKRAMMGEVLTWAATSVTLQSGRTVTFSWALGTRSMVSREEARNYFYQYGMGATSPSHTADGPTVLPVRYPENSLNLTAITFPGGTVTLSYDSGVFSAVTVKYGSTTVETITLTHDSGDDSMLESVTLGDGGKYSFTYDTQKCGPASHMDYWGFLTSATGTTGRAPSMRISTNVSGKSVSVEGSVRTPNATAMQARILRKIVYPTGGVAEWQYEPHRFKAQKFIDYVDISNTKDTELSFGGGIRVKSVTLRENPSDQNPRTVSFLYGKGGDGNACVVALPKASTFVSQDIFVAPNASMSEMYGQYGQSVSGDSVSIKNDGLMTEKVDSELQSTNIIGEFGHIMAMPASNYGAYHFGEELIWYDEVSEIHAEGKITHHFEKTLTNSVARSGVGMITPTSLNAVFGRSLSETSTDIYKGGSGGYSLVEKKEYTYTVDNGAGAFPGLYIRRNRTQASDGRTAPDFAEAREIEIRDPRGFGDKYYYGERDIYTPLMYAVATSVTRLTSVKSTTYTGNGPYSVTETYSYLPGTQLRSSATLSNASGKIVRETFYTDSLSTAVAASMKAANVVGMVTGERETSGSSMQEYMATYSSMRSGRLFRPSAIHLRRGTAARHVARNYEWNTDGTLRSYKGADGVTTTLTWDTYGRYPLTRTIGGTLKSVAEWKPLVGVSSLTDPSGVKTVYGYDTHNRLSSVTCAGSLLESYLYTLGQTGDNSVTTRRYSSSSAYVTTVERYDGLGRLRGAFSDLPGGTVGTLTEYDALGREWRQWAPAPVSTNTASASVLMSGAKSAHSDQHPYSETSYESSPRQLATAILREGDQWHDNSKKRTTDIYTNDSGSHSCNLYRITSSGVTKSGVWPDASLSVVLVTDEDGLTEERYTDLRGNTVCVKHGGDATYYVYDDYGDLRYILPPGTESGGNRTDTGMRDLAYWYDYDNRGRCVAKKLPGVAESRCLYDNADRLVAEHTHDHPSGVWRLYAYDSCGRKVITLSCTMTDTEAAAYASVCRTATLSASGTVKGYTITPSPTAKVLSANVETALYYDTYDFIDNLSIGSNYKFKNPFTALGLSSRVSAGQRGKPLSGGSKGKLTGLYTGAGWESYHYNPWGQEVQRYATGYNRGRRTTFYNHDGSVASVHCQYLEGSLAQTSFSSLRDRDTYFTYDKAGRLTKTRVLERYIPPHTSSEKVDSAITVITYDRLGRLSSEKRGTVTRTTAYDVHGWLRSQTTQLSGNTLTETLTYAGGTAPRYNGFISGRSWDGNTYAYTYDGRGFLSEAKYTSSVPLADYSETMTYDERGAVITLKRKGVTDLSPSGTKSYGLLDDIHASYSGNRPTTLTVESAAEVFDRRTGIRGSGTFSMTYDDAGRLVSDASRGITSVEYDNNGLQTSITIGSGDTRTEVIHSRDGLGNRLSTDIVKFYPNGSPPWHIEQSSYTGDGHIIRDGKLVMSRFPGGYFDYSGNPHYYPEEETRRWWSAGIESAKDSSLC